MPPLIMNLKALRRSLGRRQGDGAGVFGVVVLVLGGLLYEARLVPTGQPTQLVVLGLLLVSVVLLATASSGLGSGRKFHVGGAAFLPAAVAGVMFLINALMNDELPLEQSLGRLLAVAILVLAGLGASISPISIEDICRIIVSSVLFILIVTAFRPEVWRACDIFKCGPFGAIYTGPFSSENALAIFACVGILCVLASRSVSIAFWTLIPLALTLYATESRTSQAALTGAIATWFSLVLWKKMSVAGRSKLSGQLRFQAGVVIVIVAGLFASSFYLILTAEPSSFSNRGNIWIRALDALDGDWWRGLGLDRWSYLQSIGILPLLFPHSQYLLLLFGGGVAAVAVLLVFFGSVIRRSAASSSSLTFASAYIVFLSILGLTEVYWNPMAFDGHTFLVLPLIFLMVAGRRDAAEVTSQDKYKIIPALRAG
ncbi:O-antigen ligase family protein [Arthrobacter sp. UYEF36]|uniref:O-antigen ligase family protein n=1 Tax=Arthrobacter sp. UYEF36 TaxID=1756366 RepID=UPI003392C8F9